MSIKEIIKKILCKDCEICRPNSTKCTVKTDSDFYTQQIISEIVGELEKNFICNYGIRGEEFNNGIDKCIETIKKMGEV